MNPIKTCRECGAKFEAKHSNTAYCSDECRGIVQRRRGRKAAARWRAEGGKGDRERTRICKECGKEFTPTPKQRHIKYCSDECRRIARVSRRAKRRRVRGDDQEQWRETCAHCGKLLTGMQGRYCSRSCEQMWGCRNNPIRRANHDKHTRRYAKTEKGKVAHKRAHKKYLGTEKGREYVARHPERHKATWKWRGTQLIHIEERPCAVCGETDADLLQCDHIVPRALGGTDEWGNLQVLCKGCHSRKTKIDMVKIMERVVLKVMPVIRELAKY